MLSKGQSEGWMKPPRFQLLCNDEPNICSLHKPLRSSSLRQKNAHLPILLPPIDFAAKIAKLAPYTLGKGLLKFCEVFHFVAKSKSTHIYPNVVLSKSSPISATTEQRWNVRIWVQNSAPAQEIFRQGAFHDLFADISWNYISKQYLGIHDKLNVNHDTYTLKNGHYNVNFVWLTSVLVPCGTKISAIVIDDPRWRNATITSGKTWRLNCDELARLQGVIPAASALPGCLRWRRLLLLQRRCCRVHTSS